MSHQRSGQWVLTAYFQEVDAPARFVQRGSNLQGMLFMLALLLLFKQPCTELRLC